MRTRDFVLALKDELVKLYRQRLNIEIEMWRLQKLLAQEKEETT